MTESAATDGTAVIQRLLRTARVKLGLEIAFVSQFREGRRHFRYVDQERTSPVQPGASDPVEESYCHYVVEGSIPEFLADPSQHPVAAGLQATDQFPVGTHLSVPIRLSDGRVYGTFCCFSTRVERHLSPADVRGVELLAALAAEWLEDLEATEQLRHREAARVRRILDDPEGVGVVFQPIVEIATMRTVGLEALARFPGEAGGPMSVFGAAQEVGLTTELDLKAVRAALDHLPQLPAETTLNVNVSPATLVTGEFRSLLRDVPGGRVTVEVTEHDAMEDYTQLRTAAAELRREGVGLAIDDVGVGFSGLFRILETSPSQLKIDRAVVSGVDRDQSRQALIAALVSFAAHSGASVIAEGIETAEELRMLGQLRVPLGQGFHLARPAPLSELAAVSV